MKAKYAYQKNIVKDVGLLLAALWIVFWLVAQILL
jgi:hypothetical protein